jgi:acetamidase/formamidase
VGIEREDILLIKVCVAKVSIPGNNRVKDSSGVGLPEDLQRGLTVHSRVAHRKEKPSKLDMGIEIPLHLFDGFADLDSALSHM